MRLPGQALPVLRGADVTVRAGETCGVFGRSGSGKTTLLRAVAGLIPWSRHAEVRGSVMLDGEDVGDLDPAQRAHLLATCLDRPEAQLFLATPRHELAPAPRLHGESVHLDDVISALGVAPLLDRRVLENVRDDLRVAESLHSGRVRIRAVLEEGAHLPHPSKPQHRLR